MSSLVFSPSAGQTLDLISQRENELALGKGRIIRVLDRLRYGISLLCGRTQLYIQIRLRTMRGPFQRAARPYSAEFH